MTEWWNLSLLECLICCHGVEVVSNVVWLNDEKPAWLNVIKHCTNFDKPLLSWYIMIGKIKIIFVIYKPTLVLWSSCIDDQLIMAYDCTMNTLTENLLVFWWDKDYTWYRHAIQILWNWSHLQSIYISCTTNQLKYVILLETMRQNSKICLHLHNWLLKQMNIVIEICKENMEENKSWFTVYYSVQYFTHTP